MKGRRKEDQKVSKRKGRKEENYDHELKNNNFSTAIKNTPTL